MVAHHFGNRLDVRSHSDVVRGEAVAEIFDEAGVMLFPANGFGPTIYRNVSR